MGLDRSKAVIGSVREIDNNCVEIALIVQDDVLPEEQQLSMSSLVQVGMALERPQQYTIPSKGECRGAMLS